jgi:ABC-type Fe3+-siderophore transport system permease subunit
MSDRGEPGFRFYAKIAGVVAGVGLAILIVFLFVTKAIFAWGFFGAFAAIAAVLLVVGWLSDRRETHRRETP